MHVKKIVCFFSVLLLFSALMCSVDALPDTTVSFHGGGVTIDLTFPEEAHPTDSIWHNATVTANTALKLNFTIVIEALVNLSWQEITREDKKNRDLSQSEILPISMRFTPQNANGSLRCFIYLQTNQTADDVSYMFYTTRVSELTFSEMQSLYYGMLANYTELQANYTMLLNEHDSLLANYTSLFANYTALLSQHNNLLANYATLQANYTTLLNEYNGLLANYNSTVANYTALLSEHNNLLAKYNNQVATHDSLSNSYTELSGDYNTLDANYKSQRSNYNALQADYNSLNSTRYSLQANYTTLQAVYDALNQAYNNLLTDLNDLEGRFSDSQSELDIDRIVMFIFIVTVACLIAFIIYIKRKEPEPYVVIRKETVAVKPDEKS